ncbi:MAG TPA: thiamine-phosphate kinase [Tepidisphaeraceae bacterium]|nr:thiamine-phosphate kinase [Tepidisphaeraceae bacterium]
MGEADFLQWLAAQAGAHPLILHGIGDDLAVLKWPENILLIGADQVLDEVHFNSRVHSPEAIGRKAMNRNLSDCAAMACLPAAAVVTVALPRGSGLEYAKALYRGLRQAGDAADCAVVGGDTGSWEGKLAMSVAILGRTDGIKPISRAGGKAGDTLFVTGALGGSLLGRHMTFTPRVELARRLARQYEIHAMIDLSDGLSRDLGQICAQSGAGAVVNGERIPIHDDAVKLAARDGRMPLEHALHDGEDYELLFASPSASIDEAIAIGRLTAEGKIWLETDGKREALEPRAWEHAL